MVDIYIVHGYHTVSQAQVAMGFGYEGVVG